MKKVRSKILLMCFGLVLGLLLAEGLCKILDLRAQRAKQAVVERISRVSDLEEVRYELIPGVTAVTPGQKVAVRVNNLGFRGPDISPKKPAGVVRICVIGDSITFARYLPDEQTFVRLIETQLNESPAPGTRYEVINCGLSGRDTWEEAGLLRGRVLALDPDLVMLQICLNDHVRLPKPRAHSPYGAFGERAWYSYSSLLRMLDNKVEGFREGHVAALKDMHMEHRTAKEMMNDQGIAHRRMLQIEEHWDAWRSALNEFHNLCVGAQVRDLFAVFPLREQIAGDDPETVPVLNRWMEERGIPYIDLIGVFRTKKQTVLRDYTHPNAYGNQLVTGALTKKITEVLQQSPDASPVGKGSHAQPDHS